jgi:hypothetical protein
VLLAGGVVDKVILQVVSIGHCTTLIRSPNSVRCKLLTASRAAILLEP